RRPRAGPAHPRGLPRTAVDSASRRSAMATSKKPRVIAIEEHYWDKEVAATFEPVDRMRGAPGIVERLYDLTDLRIKEMDEAGIDFQVLSHGAPATQRGDAETSVKLARGANDRLREIVNARPDRFAAFACLPRPTPRPPPRSSSAA